MTTTVTSLASAAIALFEGELLNAETKYHQCCSMWCYKPFTKGIFVWMAALEQTQSLTKPFFLWILLPLRQN